MQTRIAQDETKIIQIVSFPCLFRPEDEELQLWLLLYSPHTQSPPLHHNVNTILWCGAGRQWVCCQVLWWTGTYSCQVSDTALLFVYESTVTVLTLSANHLKTIIIRRHDTLTHHQQANSLVLDWCTTLVLWEWIDPVQSEWCRNAALMSQVRSALMHHEVFSVYQRRHHAYTI